MPHARKDNLDWLPDNYYHLYNRGARRLKIFLEADNYIFVLHKVKKYSAEFDLTVIAYCLMPNHYHFLIRQNSNLAAGLLPQRVFNSYSKAYNKKYKHNGTLFEGRFKAKHILDDTYMRHICRYIHANPVKDKLVDRIEDWPYSNYLEWMGLRSGTLFDPEFVIDFFESKASYKKFVLDFIATHQLPDDLDCLE